MKLSDKKSAAKAFAKKWEGKGYEKGEADKFWLELLQNVYGVQNVFDFIKFEEQVHLDHTSFIDGWIPLTHVLIEQKGIGKDLRKKIKQSDGSELTPFQQAKRYSTELPYSERPRWIVTCNFESFLIYDMENPCGEPQEVLLKNLGREFYRLDFISELGNEHIQKEMDVSLKAGDLVGEIYEKFSKQYKNINDEHSIQSLNKLSVRLVFCLYAEDAGLFGQKNMFHDYLSSFDYKRQRQALIDLFKTLNTPYNERDPYLSDDLVLFPYVNGGMFADDDIEIPNFTEELSELLLGKCADNFDWSDISPTIFGAVFESTLNPETRRSGGMHYTSIENIHKVIDPLFLDELHQEFEEIKSLKRDRDYKLEQFQMKLAGLKFLDPACGSGNFLTETYISLRRLENEIIKILNRGYTTIGFKEEKNNPIKVSINQFYGIEINDFAVSVAKTALWIAESQMLDETMHIVYQNIDFFPLKTYTNIFEGNSLRMDWNSVIDSSVVNYVFGNPPFKGYSEQTEEQKHDIISVYTDSEGNSFSKAGKIDYVAGWYFKAAEYAYKKNIIIAFVSTNSIVQGEQVEGVWEPLIERFNIEIVFAHQSFKWKSESNVSAQVYCVIIGFTSCFDLKKNKMLINDGQVNNAKFINFYLKDGPNIIVKSRTSPICNVPKITNGSKPADGGFLLLSYEECKELTRKEPLAQKYIRLFYNADEFVNNKKRYCLWLVDANPSEIKQCPLIIERIKKVKEFRESSKKEVTRRDAKKPMLFQQIRQPKNNYILIPRHTTSGRKYVPFGFMSENIICGDANSFIENANLWHFGVINSNVHMIWLKTVCGRLGDEYRYSAKIVYNNFPWPNIIDTRKIENTAKEILRARAIYLESPLADLYDDLLMPKELVEAHEANDKAVMDAYGFDYNMSESEIVARLMEMYKKITS